MVQGLAFLSKKSWHTKNLSNQEKVWVAEQRKDAEDQKTKELAKQIQQEREEEEMEKISGKKGSRLDRGIDWMYQGKTGELAKEDAERKAEEFLLGKEFVGDGATQGDFDNGDQDQGINTVLKQQEEHAAQQDAAASSSAFANEPSVKDRNEDFRMRVEDPMFMVAQKQREKEVRHDNTKALYERVVGYHEHDKGDGKPNKEEDHVHKKEKKAKKEKKRHKKHKKSSKRNRDHKDDSGDSYSEDDSKRRHEQCHLRRSRSPSLDRNRSKRHKRSPSYDRRRSPRSDEGKDSRYDRRDRHQNHRDEDRQPKRSRHHHGREEESSSRDKRLNHVDRSDGKDDYKDSRRSRRYDDDDDRRRYHDDRDHKRHHDDRYRDHHHHHDRRNSRDEDRTQRRTENNGHHQSKPAPGESPAQAPQKEGYGLKGASVTVDRTNLGPSRDLLLKKLDEREAERRRIRDTASSRRQRTEAERARDLEEMQANARKREESRSKGQNKKYDDDEGEPVPRRGDASFLKDITRQTHGIGEGGQTLSSRVAQNRHTNQRLHDSFL
jgi:hypothetical protein